MINRRKFIKYTTAAAAGGLMSPFLGGPAGAASNKFVPEKGAKIKIMRWKRFIQAEEDAFMKIVADFTKEFGVEVSVVSESLDDVQPKASVSANVGSGPDMVWGLYSLPHLFPKKLVSLNDVADQLGKDNGGWVPSAVKYGKSGNNWIGIPVTYNGNFINYRKSLVAAAGFSNGIPTKTDEFLEMMKAMNAKGTPGGFALGHASGDGNAWVHWALWSHGASLTDANDKVVVNSPETRASLEYVKKLYDTFVPGTISWNDSFNNKAFLSGQIAVTNNGVSIYAAALKDKMDMADDIDHALWPIGPVGKPTEFHIAYPISIFRYSKYPKACKAFIYYMMSPKAYDPWLEAAVGYLTQPLNAYEANPIWKNPKLAICKDAAKRTLTAGYPGSVGENAAATLADFVVLDMYANYVSGRMDIEEAVKQAERQTKRIYR